MGKIKSYPDINQCKKLKEILPIESADMHWQYIEEDNGQLQWFCFPKDFSINQHNTVPAWSLAALLSVIKPVNDNTYTLIGTLDGGVMISFEEVTNVAFQEKEIIDAVFEMLVWLKESGKI